MNWTRRKFCRVSMLPGIGICLNAGSVETVRDQRHTASGDPPRFTIGLSPHSLRHMLRTGQLDPLDYPPFVADQFGIEQIGVFPGVLPPAFQSASYLEKLRRQCDRSGTTIVFMMGPPLELRSDRATDQQAEVDRLKVLVDQTAVVGARYLRIGLDCGSGALEVQMSRAVHGLRQLADYASERHVSLLVEPGIGPSRNLLWLAKVLREIDHPHCGCMPDFASLGSQVKCGESTALLASPPVVIAKPKAFSEGSLELRSNYPELIQTMAAVRFGGIVCIEYEGESAEIAGIQATQKLLVQLREICARS